MVASLMAFPELFVNSINNVNLNCITSYKIFLPAVIGPAAKAGNSVMSLSPYQVSKNNKLNIKVKCQVKSWKSQQLKIKTNKYKNKNLSDGVKTQNNT